MYCKYSYMFRCICIVFRETYPSTLLNYWVKPNDCYNFSTVEE